MTLRRTRRATVFRRARLLACSGVAIASSFVTMGCDEPPPDLTGKAVDAGSGSDATVTVNAPPDASESDSATAIEAGTPRTPVKSEVTSTRVTTWQLLFASGEMQISGEPFASTFAGRNLGFYDRTWLPPNMYLEGVGTEEQTPLIDLFGFSTAVESYEYSKYYMNIIANQSAAGVSLANGPVVQKYSSETGVVKGAATTASAKLVSVSNSLLTAVGSDVSGNSILPAPTSNPLNILGFQGLWPNMLPFRSFDPSITPSSNVVSSCNFSGGYGGIPSVNSLTPQFECAYNSLHLNNREAQVEKIITPQTLGMATWKEAIWAIDFVGRLHDAASNNVNAVTDADGPLVGTHGNLVVGTDPPGASSGTFIGSTPIEGMWGVFMLTEADNAAELLVTKLTTTDGTSLSGFASRNDATAYDYTSPLRWFPTAVSVAEDTTSDSYPLVTGYTLNDGHSASTDLSALLLGHAMVFGMTDARNVGVGQRIGLKLAFDGDPFAKDDGVADGEETLHDRALAVLRVAFVDLDRIHGDPTTGVLLDSAAIDATSKITRSPTVTTPALAHALIALRQTLLSVNGSITQYGAADPDPAADANGILNTPVLHVGGATPTFSARVRSVFITNADFFMSTLTKADGTVAIEATLANGAFTTTFGGATIEAQTAAARALTEAFLVTGDTKYRDRARAVVTHLLSPAFYSTTARMFRGVEGGADTIDMTPEVFAWLSSSLRETYKALRVDGDSNGGSALGRTVLEDRIQRVMKLFANGWDDLNGDGSVDMPGECLAGRMQQGEQALTGELGEDAVGVRTTDRDSDCIVEIDKEPYGAVMAGSVHFHAP